VVNAISLIYTWNTFSTLNELNTLIWILGAVYLFLITDDKEALIRATLVGAALSSFCMIIQAKVLFPKLFELSLAGRDVLILGERVVPFSSFINESPLGGIFLTLLTVSLYFAIFKRNILCVITSVFVLFGLALAMSRIAMILAFFCLVTVTIILIMKHRSLANNYIESRNWKNGIIIFFGIIVFTGILFMFFTYGNLLGNKQDKTMSRIQKRIEYRIKNVSLHITTLDARTEIWSVGMDAFLAKPFIGYGAGTFEYAFRKYYKGSIYTQHAHSSVLKIAVETGFLGLLTFLFYIIGIAKGIIKKTTLHNQTIFLILSFISCFLFSVANISFEVPAFIILFFVISSTFFIDDGIVEKIHKQKIISYVTFIIIIFLLILSFFFTTKNGLSEKSIQNGIAFEEYGFLNDAYNSYRDALSLMPIKSEGLTRSIGVLMQLYSKEGEAQKKSILKKHIIQSVEKLETIKDKDSEVFFLISIAQNFLGDNNKTGKNIEIARAYYPASVHYAFEAAKIYYNNRQSEKAEKTIKSIDIFMPNYLIFGHLLHGLYIYKIKDLESVIEYQNGNLENALKIAEENLENAEKRRFSISRAREHITEEQIINILKNRVNFYKHSFQQRQQK